MKSKKQHRLYLWTDDGPWRLPIAFITENRTLPQYAGTKQKTISAYRDEFGEVTILTRNTGYIALDAEGRWDRQRAAISGMGKMIAHDQKCAAMRASVPNLAAVRAAQDEINRLRWEPTEADKERIMLDMTGKKPIPIVRPKVPD